MSAEEKLKSVGFRKQSQKGGDACLFCNYYYSNSDKNVESCELLKINFWEDYKAGKYVCSKFNGSIMDSLIDAMKGEGEETLDYSVEKQNNQTEQKEGCYIATAVYGSYDAPEVLVLRRFRDSVLKKTKGGRLFIKIYYAVSPQLAYKLKKHTFINNKIKFILDQMVSLIIGKLE